MARLAGYATPSRLKRATIALVALVLVAAGAMAIRATIAVEAARHEIEESLSALTGAPLRLAGTAVVRLAPWPRVHFEDVVLARADGGAVVARMDALDASLDVAALVLGRLRAEEMRLIRPDIRVDLAGPGFAPRALAALAGGWKPVTIAVEKGRVTAVLPSGEEVFDAVDARFAWPRPSAKAELRAGLRWRGESIGLDVEAPSPSDLIGGGSGRASLRLTSAPLRLTLTGSAGLVLPTRFDGTIDAEIADAARFARWTGRPRTPDLAIGRLRLEGPLSADLRGATAPNARVDLAGNKGEGALALRWDGLRPRLSGTVAFAELDLSGERRRTVGDGWRRAPVDAETPGIDLDLRLSAKTLRLAGATLSKVAAALLIAEGRLNAEIGEAELFGKPLSASIRGTFGRNGLEAQIRSGVDDLPLTEIATRLELPGVEAGRAAVSFEAETRCRVLADCLTAIDGRVRLDARAVTVTGASPFADISRFRPIVPQSNGTTVTATWDRVFVDMRLVGPRVEVGHAEILGQSARFLFTGAGDLATGAVDLTGNAYFPAFRPDPARTGTTEVAVPMRIGGTLRRLEAMARDAAPTNGTPLTPTVSP